MTIVIVGLLMIGVLAGKAIQHAHHAGRTYRTAKENLPVLKAAASTSEIRGALWIIAVVVVSLLTVAAAARLLS